MQMVPVGGYGEKSNRKKVDGMQYLAIFAGCIVGNLLARYIDKKLDKKLHKN